MVDILKKNKKIILIIWLCILLAITILLASNNHKQLKVIKQVELTSGRRSYANKEEGAWNLTKTAKWIAFRKAQIEFNFDSIAKNVVILDSITTARETFAGNDILLVIDTSSAMQEEKFEQVKSVLKELIEYKFSKGNDNKLGIITFDSDSNIISNLTNNQSELMSKIDLLTVNGGATNYYKALVNIENVLQDYVAWYGGLSVVFLTSGYPNIDTPLETGEYSILKDKYPFIKIKGIQYEMSDEILKPLTKISDYQYVANNSNLKDILFEATSNEDCFEKVEIIDYIHDDFKVISEDDLKPSIGTAKLESENGKQKVIWTINSDTLITGKNANLTIDVTLQETSYDKEYVITNEKEEITVKLPDEESETQKTTIRPTLKNASKVIYNGNSPSDCTISNVPSIKHYAPFETVTIEEGPNCNGYVFKNWDIDNYDIDIINKNTFIMLDEDIELTARWGKYELIKSMDGEVAKRELTGVEYLIERANDLYITSYEDGNKNEMYTFRHFITDNSPVIIDYRYIGDSPSNYVYFNCIDDEDVNTCEKWRILGVFDVSRTDPDDSSKNIIEKRIKIVKNNAFSMRWNRSYYYISDWIGSPIKDYLNGDFSTTDFYQNLSMTAKSQIEQANYNFCTMVYGSYGSTENLYYNENSGICKKWEGNVALMYPSDVYMTYANGVDDDCYDDPGSCYSSNSTEGGPSKSWIYTTNKVQNATSNCIIWLFSKNNVGSAIQVVGTNGMLTVYNLDNYSQGTRPVVYLKSDIKISGGDGTENSPYVLSI